MEAGSVVLWVLIYLSSLASACELLVVFPSSLSQISASVFFLYFYLKNFLAVFLVTVLPWFIHRL